MQVVDVLVAVTASRPLDALTGWLHPSEQDGWRAQVDPADRERSLTGRALLRALVARVTGRDAAEILFVARCPVCGGEDHGRPQVVGDGPFTSVAHAGAVVLAAVATVPLGIDVDRCAAGAFEGFDDVALTPAERGGIAELPPAAQLDARTTIWVRKEALLKRHEVGLSVDPRLVEVGVGEPDRLIADPLAPPSRVALVGLAVATGYRAALAVATDRLPTVTMLDSRQLWAARGVRSRRSSG